MRRRVASHPMLPDGFRDKLEALAAHVGRLPLMTEPHDLQSACAAIGGDLARLASFRGPPPPVQLT